MEGTSGRRFHQLTVARVDALTDDSAAISFTVPDHLHATFAFRAGQALTLRRTVAGTEQRRSYSICSAAGQPPRIGVREIPDGLFSSWLVRDVRPGDVVEVLPPTGRFSPDQARGGNHLCIAAGSGITPMLSIAATVLAHPQGRVTLLYGNRTSRSVMFADELADLKDTYGPRLHLAHVLSREPRDVELLSGRLDPARLRRLLLALVPVSGLDHAWLCGPFELVTGARGVLTSLGVPAERVHVELFHVDEPPPAVRRQEVAESSDTSEVTVVLDGRTTIARVARDRSLLDGAGTTRGDVPFACRGGVCGTCRARVSSGQADMRRNYALDEDELARGYVLTCQSMPVSDRLTVDFDA